MSLSRRDLLFGFFKREETPEETTTVHWQNKPTPQQTLRARQIARTPRETGPMVAKVMPFSCLNQLGGFCGTCIERCPEPGAIVMTGRVPIVEPSKCTGCRKCHDLCPAPSNAILMIPGAPDDR